MKLLFVTPYLPSPPTFGGQRRLHGLMRALAARHQLGLLALHNSNDPLPLWLERTREWCKDVEVFVNPAFGHSTKLKRAAQLWSLAQRRSYDASSNLHAPLRDRLAAKLKSEQWDVVVVEFCQTMINLEGLDRGRVPVLLDEHNVEFDLQRRAARSGGGALRRLYGEVNWRKLQREELAAWRRADAVTVTSDRDLALVRAEAPGTRCVVVPNGVDINAFRPPTAAPEPGKLVFFGAHNYFPNTDALRFLFAEVWPLIRAARPDAHLDVVGPPPPGEVIASAPPGVTFKGFVDDLAAEVGRAAVSIAPLRVGGGTRLKIIEAMALGRAVVSTTIGAEGLNVTSGQELILADGARDFAAAVCKLLADPAAAAALGARGRVCAEQQYGWEACAAKLEAVLATLVRA